MKKTIFFFGVILLCNKCGKPTNACFTSSPTTIAAGDEVTFTAGCSSKNSSYFRWSFGDGTKDTITINKTITHKFLVSGSYSVKLTASRKDGVAFRQGKPETVSTVVVQ